MMRFVKIILFSLLLNGYQNTTWASEDNAVCTDIGGVMYGAKTECKKGDIIMVNPMMAAFLCDMTLPSITGENIIICHFLGKKRPQRGSQK